MRGKFLKQVGISALSSAREKFLAIIPSKAPAATHVMWEIEVLPEAARDLDKLDRQHANRILKFLHERVSKLHDPRAIGAALRGSKFGGYWKYRVGDYRIISKIEDDRLLILVVRVAHRREVYR